MEMVKDLTEFWSKIDQEAYHNYQTAGIRALGENIRKRIDAPVQSGKEELIGANEEIMRDLPDWRDVILPFPSTIPGERVPDRDIEDLCDIVDIFSHCRIRRERLARSDILKESEKYLLRALPVDEVPRSNPEVSKSRISIDENSSIVLKSMRKQADVP
jgi:hypothetical protein